MQTLNSIRLKHLRIKSPGGLQAWLDLGHGLSLCLLALLSPCGLLSEEDPQQLHTYLTFPLTE